jgi:hypothetical protein
MSTGDTKAPRWKPLGNIDPGRLGEARLQAHYAVQWLARAARGYLTAQPDDSHTNLGWNDGVEGFVSHPLKDGLRISLGIADLTLRLHGTNDTSSLSFAGRTDAQVRQWLGEQVQARGLDPAALDAPSPYPMPPHPVAGGAAYQTTGIPDALAALAGWYGNAAALLDLIRSGAVARGLDASPLRCWPHHFDLATLISFPTRQPEMTGYVGAGLSPGDDSYDEPYFYVSVYPKPDRAALPPLPAIAHWHTRGFIAAVATAQSILGTASPQAEVAAYLRRAVDGAIGLLRA